MTMPVSGTMTFDPKRVFTVVVVEIARPVWSATEMCEVPGLGLSDNVFPVSQLECGDIRFDTLESFGVIHGYILRLIVQYLVPDFVDGRLFQDVCLVF